MGEQLYLLLGQACVHRAVYAVTDTEAEGEADQQQGSEGRELSLTVFLESVACDVLCMENRSASSVC